MRIIGFVGTSGSGKTTLISALIPELGHRGLAVSTIKHTHHNVSIDRPGDASRALAAGGAIEVVLAGPERWAVLHENRDDPEPSLEALAARLAPVDVLLVEGFKRHDHQKIEVHRAAAGGPLLCRGDPAIIAIATDTPLDDTGRPLLDVNDIPAVADFVIDRCGLGRG